MKAALCTHDKTIAFSMSEIEVFHDGSGMACCIELVSGPFAASPIQVCFDEPSLEVFVQRLALLEKTLVGEARLGQRYEESYVLFEGDGLGHVAVSGTLVEGFAPQRLQFSFTTDQTALRPFVAGLQEMAKPDAT